MQQTNHTYRYSSGTFSLDKAVLCQKRLKLLVFIIWLTRVFDFNLFAAKAAVTKRPTGPAINGRANGNKLAPFKTAGDGKVPLLLCKLDSFACSLTASTPEFCN